MRFNTPAEWLAWQETLHPRTIELGLERVREVLHRMRLTRRAPVVVTVAGTNGKGSCVAMLDAMLRAAGYRTGAYTSPHLLRYNERIAVGGVEVTDGELVDAFQHVDEARGDISLTYFEFGTLAALHVFDRADLEVVLLEVGLGGRLDAVNVVDADCTLITTIGVDHAEWLGPDRESIAREKAGVMRAGRPAVFGDRDMPDAIRAEAERIGAALLRLGRDFDFEDRGEKWEFRVGARLRATGREGLPKPTLPGDFQLANAAACLTVLATLAERIPVDDTAVARGLRSARLPGRLQRVEIEGVEVILDVAHNPQAAMSLASALDALPARRPQVAVFAQLQDKDSAGVVEALRERFDHWYLAGLDGDRGLSGHELANRVLGRVPTDRFTVCRAVRHALDLAVHGTGREGRVVVFGSFRTVEAVAGELQVNRTGAPTP